MSDVTFSGLSGFGSGTYRTDDAPPLLATFDFSSMKGDWDHRFLICSGLNVENAAFVM